MKVCGVCPRRQKILGTALIFILKNYFLFASLLLTINNRNKSINECIDMLNIFQKERIFLQVPEHRLCKLT